MVASQGNYVKYGDTFINSINYALDPVTGAESRDNAVFNSACTLLTSGGFAFASSGNSPNWQPKTRFSVQSNYAATDLILTDYDQTVNTVIECHPNGNCYMTAPTQFYIQSPVWIQKASALQLTLANDASHYATLRVDDSANFFIQSCASVFIDEPIYLRPSAGSSSHVEMASDASGNLVIAGTSHNMYLKIDDTYYSRLTCVSDGTLQLAGASQMVQTIGTHQVTNWSDATKYTNISTDALGHTSISPNGGAMNLIGAVVISDGAYGSTVASGSGALSIYPNGGNLLVHAASGSSQYLTINVDANSGNAGITPTGTVTSIVSDLYVYNKATGTDHTSFSTNSSGNLIIAPSGGTTEVDGTFQISGGGTNTSSMSVSSTALIVNSKLGLTKFMSANGTDYTALKVYTDGTCQIVNTQGSIVCPNVITMQSTNYNKSATLTVDGTSGILNIAGSSFVTLNGQYVGKSETTTISEINLVSPAASVVGTLTLTGTVATLRIPTMTLTVNLGGGHMVITGINPLYRPTVITSILMQGVSQGVPVICKMTINTDGTAVINNGISNVGFINGTSCGWPPQDLVWSVV